LYGNRKSSSVAAGKGGDYRRAGGQIGAWACGARFALPARLFCADFPQPGQPGFHRIRAVAALRPFFRFKRDDAPRVGGL